MKRDECCSPGIPGTTTTVYEARIVSGSPAPADGELSEVAWFAAEELRSLALSGFARALLRAVGRL